MRILMVIAISCMVSAAGAQPLLTAQIRSYIYEINTYMDFEDVEGFIFDRADSIYRTLLRYRDQDVLSDVVTVNGKYLNSPCQLKPDLANIEVLLVSFTDFYKKANRRPRLNRDLLNRGFPENKLGVIAFFGESPRSYGAYITRVKADLKLEYAHIFKDPSSAADEDIISYLDRLGAAFELGSRLWAVDYLKELHSDERRILITYLFESWCYGHTISHFFKKHGGEDVATFRNEILEETP